MASLKTVHLSQTPSTTLVHAALYTEVKNAPFLRQQLLNGNEEFEYAFLDASMIVSTNHIYAAVSRALNDAACSRLKTRNLHSEIVFALSPNNNIAESFRRFGIQDSTTSLLVLKVTTSDTPTASDIQSHLSANVEGNSVELSDETLEELTDKARVRKVYKINVNAGGGAKNAVVNGNGAGEKESVKLESDVLGVMALRGAA